MRDTIALCHMYGAGIGREFSLGGTGLPKKYRMCSH